MVEFVWHMFGPSLLQQWAPSGGFCFMGFKFNAIESWAFITVGFDGLPYTPPSTAEHDFLFYGWIAKRTSEPS